jgi:hypothetical protein
MGQLLGYPTCCCEYFVAHTPKQQKTNNDYVAPLLKHHTHDQCYQWQTNVFMRYGDFVLLSHFPCSLQCEQSKVLAQSYHECLVDIRATYIKTLTAMLKLPVVYTEDQGVFFLQQSQTTSVRCPFDITYTGVFGTTQNTLYHQLAHHTTLHVNKKSLALDQPIPGTLVMYQ